MRDFDHQLLRLKQALRVTEDQDVAEALDMTKAAFSARKTRGVFPEDRLYALAAKRPAAKLDVKYILTGQSDELERRLKAVKVATTVAGKVKDREARYEVQQAVFEAIVGSLSLDEQQLIHHYRAADANGKTAIAATAASMASLLTLKTKPKKTRTKR